MKRYGFFLLTVFLSAALNAQIKWIDPLDGIVPHVQGRAWNMEIGNNYHRLPERAKNIVRKPVWDLSTNSAGLFIDFYCNAPELIVKYTVSGNKTLPNLTTIAVSGLDLYSTDCHGVTDWCACPGNYSFGTQTNDTIIFHYKDLVYHNYHQRGNEYRLFLPLYNTVTSLKIGIPDSCELKFAPLPSEKPILIYGTSIAQGASASRPAMAWTNIVQRRIDSPVINLGFSGNGLMDASVYDLISEVDAQIYILDCMPNMYSIHDSIVSRTIAGVRKIRAKSKAPVLLVENDGYMYGKTNRSIENECIVTNRELKKAYELLLAEGVKNLFYLTNEEIGMTPDAQTDGWHASDIGMQLYADAYVKKINEILGRHPMSLFEPCRQRREPDHYEWAERHEAVVKMNRTTNPEILMIGNSIINFWGGEPAGYHHSGIKAWNNLFGKRHVTNMGFGWDRIENVFWRIYHGELDGCHPKHICLLIGTNNLEKNTNDEIVSGIIGLVNLIREEQPQAYLHVLSVFPRQGQESRIVELNSLLQTKLITNDKVDLIDLTPQLILKDGTGKIDNSLFTDGLHPNETGYGRIAKVLKPIFREP